MVVTWWSRGGLVVWSGAGSTEQSPSWELLGDSFSRYVGERGLVHFGVFYVPSYQVSTYYFISYSV